MIKKLLPLVVLVSCNILAMDKMHEHKSLSNDEYKTITHSSDANNMFAEFTSSLSNMQIVVVDVNGMVCDFCARGIEKTFYNCLLYTSPSPRDGLLSRMPSSA